MFYSSYFVIAVLFCFNFFEHSYGSQLSDNVFTNGGFMMNSKNEEMVCSCTCVKDDKHPITPCDQGGSTTTTKTPCPLANTTVSPSTTTSTPGTTSEYGSCLDENTGIFHSSPNDPWITNNCTEFNTCWKGKRITRAYWCDEQEECIDVETSTERCQSSKCPEGWRYYGYTGACYKTIYNVTFDQAEAKCQTFGAHVASVSTLDENEFMRGMIYLGATDIEPNDNAYIGFKKSGWVDGTMMNPRTSTLCSVPPESRYLFFPYTTYENVCLFMQAHNPPPPKYCQWYHTNCDEVFRTAICKKI